MAARCDVCGGRVMRYGRYLRWMKPTATCDECGAPVRLRRFGIMVGIGAGIILAASAVLITAPSALLGLRLGLALSALVLAVDYGSYHVLRWEADEALLDRDRDPRELPG